jgi:hypothetical protein
MMTSRIIKVLLQCSRRREIAITSRAIGPVNFVRNILIRESASMPTLPTTLWCVLDLVALGMMVIAMLFVGANP